ncbi:MAG: hypothetical protein ACRDHG_03760 [Anaerolineales bacterium]
MREPEKITIIEGPPPTFELDTDVWLPGLVEGPVPSQVAMCRLRSPNAPELVQRCYRAWRDGQPISLEYRSEEGLTDQAPIIAARWTDMDEGQVLLLWVRLIQDPFQIRIEFDDSPDDGPDDDFEPLD